MDDEQIDDLKQFITAVITQQTFDLRQDIHEIRSDIKEIRSDVKRLDTKIDGLSEHVASALDTSNDEAAKQLQDHELRITDLETKTT